MRLTVLLASVFLLAAGCAKDEPAITQSAIAPGTLTGTVSDMAFLPILGAKVWIDGTNATAVTDLTGTFRFDVLPGEYVVLASAPDHRDGALRASILSAQTSTLAFQLATISKIVPYHEVQEVQGYLSCAALLVQGDARQVHDCGTSDPNDRPVVAFDLTTIEGLETLVLEISWEPRTDAARALHADVMGRSGNDLIALGSSEGPPDFSIKIPGRLLTTRSLQITLSPAGGLTDDEAGLDAGIAFQQPFVVYATAFYHEGPPGDYTAIQVSV